MSSKVILHKPNRALLSLIENYRQILPLDTNILIPPDRSKEVRNQPSVPFEFHSKYFLEPLLQTFPYIAIHEAVYEECVGSSLQRYVKEKIEKQFIMLLKDDELSSEEEIVRHTQERSIAKWTSYNPDLGRGSDKGEVKSLAHIAVKGYIYFCSRDAKALLLIDDAERLQTNLIDQMSVRMYEILYYLYKMEMTGKPEFLKQLYKYLYYLTTSDKATNPKWGDFILQMDELYGAAIEAAEKPVKMRVS